MAVNIQQNLFDIIQRDPSQTEDVLLKKGGTLKVATIGNNFFQNLDLLRESYNIRREIGFNINKLFSFAVLLTNYENVLNVEAETYLEAVQNLIDHFDPTNNDLTRTQILAILEAHTNLLYLYSHLSKQEDIKR